MKSTIYSLPLRLSSIIILILAIPFHTNACGPYPPIIPTPNFFTSNWDDLLSDFDKQENLRLWQKLTSEEIPLEDIEQAVYKDSREKFADNYDYRNANTKNLFYIYLRNTNDSELFDFLLTAKGLEERREEINSPWYYPSSRNYDTETGDFQYTISVCNNYKGDRIKDRYALQAVRALFASRQYDKCIEYFEENFREFPNSNLFKRMAMGYVAGCWSRLGDVNKANEYFAISGDFYSIQSNNAVAFMAERNPDSPELMSYIQTCAKDSAKFCAIKPIAENILRNKKAKKLGDWAFALAYMYGEFYSDHHKASQYIRKALLYKFSSDDLRDHAYAYRIKIDAENGDYSSLLTNMKWFESKIDMLSSDANEWNRMMQNIVYTSLVPELWNRKDYTMAILLCSYADNLLYAKQYHDEITLDFTWSGSYKSQTLGEMRKSERLWNHLDYSSLSFQLMGSLSSDQLIMVKHQMDSGNALFVHLKKYVRTDTDYFNELIGTLALREENYQRATTYLASVSNEYLQTMNIYKEGSLNRDPFYAYPSRWTKDDYGEWEARTIKKPLPNLQMVKYNFAKRMLELQKQMNLGETADERGMARLKYAIGRRNAFEECWALTQYWRGEYMGLFEPSMDYWSDDGFVKGYDNILYDYKKTIGHEKTEAIYKSEVKKALGMLQTDEIKAEAEYILGNLTTIVKRYGNTTVARHIKTSCDNWQEWL